MRSSRFMATGLLSGVATAVFAAAPAQAQAVAEETAEAAPAADDDVIIVTARRREERLVDVPVAVSAISGEELAQRGHIFKEGKIGAFGGGQIILKDGNGYIAGSVPRKDWQAAGF